MKEPYMSRQIIVSLPVVDLKRSKAFYEALGATNNPQFTNEGAAWMVFSETIHVMLITHSKWATLTKKPISDAHKYSEVGLQLSFDSRDAVNASATAAGKFGGVVDVNPPEDHDFMFTRDVEDPDGHIWGLMWMDATGSCATSQG
jgi:predicted lactoylglutathione lyase